MQRNCPVCTSSSYTLIFHDHNRREGYIELEWDYVQCLSCGMSYLTNIPSFEEMGEKYEDIYVELDMVAQKKKLKDQILSNGKEILDIGCNHGTQLIPYYNKWWEVYGIDFNKRAIEDCKKYLPSQNFSVSTIEWSVFENESFDKIQTFHVLEHVYEPEAFLKKCLDLLKKGGELEIRVPHWESLEMKTWGKYSSQSWVPFHINMFNKKTITELLEWIGYTSIQVSTNPIPWWWILSFRQWNGTINRKRGVTNFHQSIFHILLQGMLLIPLWIVARFGYGEELHIIAHK